MYRGTTPTLQVRCDLRLGDCQTVWLTIKQPGVEITKEQGDLVSTDDGFAVTLTQEETLRLVPGWKANIQLRALLLTGEAVASNIVTAPVDKILKDGEIT